MPGGALLGYRSRVTVSMPRRFLGALEPLVSMIYFAPEAAEEYAALGLDPISGYFCSRSAAMGRASAEVVASAFYNFNPAMVRQFLRWDVADPDAVMAARLRAVRRVSERLLADDEGALPGDGAALPDGAGPPGDGAGLPDVERAVALLREASAACRPEGRPLYAAHARLPWPEDRLTALWHGGNLLREYRGDGHIAVLVSHGVDAVEALALHAPYLGVKREVLFQMRMWGEEETAAATERLAARGFVAPDGSLTEAGREFREMLELETDRLGAAPFDALGPDRGEELLALLLPLSRRVVERRGVPRPLARMAPEAPVG